jgi:hypothetical protein
MQQHATCRYMKVMEATLDTEYNVELVAVTASFGSES